ncbi:hypothetical protein P153DRAFT_435829 [Dothidotthia symphoricarpi CBS 119687]|uniref:Ubiquitin-like protease family profile domain-containing protein n=1 Tax=Dothidotthia symphoricarpi CBS 119687 TaxID=1392245 RepID=A0A6A5ZWB2_9PLEO|nr:uncharacterized protein P153DRAFT_435829 [Dothidotthia symphoricarpi CBS 119687]KAF2123586.1 hypothetical protein P153DRAFT_435829 [Dothidotthia symphoricarpi CBS 119687]
MSVREVARHFTVRTTAASLCNHSKNYLDIDQSIDCNSTALSSTRRSTFVNQNQTRRGRFADRWTMSNHRQPDSLASAQWKREMDETNPVVFQFGSSARENYRLQDRDNLRDGHWLHDVNIDLHSDYLNKYLLPSFPGSVFIAPTGLSQLIKDIPDEDFDSAMAQGVFPPIQYAPHIFLPINTEVSKMSDRMSVGGTHWSLVHVLLPPPDSDHEVTVRHYDPLHHHNRDEARAIMLRMRTIYGWNVHGFTGVSEETIPQTHEGTNCGVAVTWMLRQLVLRVLNGEDMTMTDEDGEEHGIVNWKFGGGVGFDAGEERAWLRQVVDVLKYGARRM